MKRIYIPKKETKTTGSPAFSILVGFITFALGCVLTATISLNVKVWSIPGIHLDKHPLQQHQTVTSQDSQSEKEKNNIGDSGGIGLMRLLSQGDGGNTGFSYRTVLQNLKILVAIASYDFSQIPHLEETLDGYHDVCMAGAGLVDVVIHSTVPYPVTLIDLLNTRFPCENFSITIILKPKSVRLHLVDFHRTLFYERINQYDLFIYTEDDIQLKPTTVGTYLYETLLIEKLLEGNTEYTPHDFNVGIVRYEYNYPSNVIIDDNTRHATQNVTRVYWEHSGFDRPVVPNAVFPIDVEVLASKGYVSMKNHHQGMYLATREHLLQWKDRKGCNFDVIKKRPGRGSQPAEGTQRVWMSSQQLYGGRRCGVKQVIPMNKFGALTVLHLPNKNYRRVGKYRNRTFSDGTEVFQRPSDRLLSAMELHIGLRKALPQEPQRPYRGIRMIDEVDKPWDRSDFLERRMKEYRDYVDRGGVLSDDDMTKLVLVESS